MPITLSNAALSQHASSSRMHTPANMAEIKFVVMVGDVNAVRARLSEEGLSGEAWHALRAHVSDSGNAPVVKESLQQVLADAALKHAVRANDLDTARQALLCGAGPEGIPAYAVADDNMRALLAYARRKNKLYPPNAPRGPETALDRALRNGIEEGDWQRAKMLLSQAIGNNPDNEKIREAWRDAVKGKQADIQRAILLLGYADQSRGFRLLQEDAVTDPGVMAVMKEIPYFSPKRGWPRNLNCEATFPGTNKEIECRHLVEHRQAGLEQSARRKFDYVQYDDVQNIAAHVSHATEAKYKHLRAHAAEAHLFHNHDFGKALVGQFGEMQRKKETSRLLLLESGSHAMSVELKVKDKDGKPHYVAALFDPNTTTSHIRFASGDMRTLEGRTLKDFLASESLYNLYYPKSDEISLMFVRPPAQAQAQAEPAREKRVAGAVKNRTLTSCIEGEQFNGKALFFMLENGFSGDIRRLKNKIAKHPKADQLQLLAAKRTDGDPGLYMALQNGHADAITAFGEALMELQVPPKDCVKLLAAKRSGDGIPGLYMALENGHADAITAFGRALKELQVPSEERVDLLTAKKEKNGVPGLFIALENGHADAIAAFGKVLGELQVPRAECAKLLAAKKDNDGVPGLYWALEDGHANAISAFGQVLKALQVPPAECAKLLAAKNAREVPGLYSALRNGHADVIAAFGQVLVELQMPSDKCVELLTAKGDNEVPGLSTALQNGKLEAVEQYVQIVKKIAPELGDEHRAALLKEIRKSHARQIAGSWWVNFGHYNELKKNNPDFCQRFEEMKNALKG